MRSNFNKGKSDIFNDSSFTKDAVMNWKTDDVLLKNKTHPILIFEVLD